MKGNGKGVALTAIYRQKHMLLMQFNIPGFPLASQPDAQSLEKLSPWKLYTFIIPCQLIRKREGWVWRWIEPRLNNMRLNSAILIIQLSMPYAGRGSEWIQFYLRFFIYSIDKWSFIWSSCFEWWYKLVVDGVVAVSSIRWGSQNKFCINFDENNIVGG